MFKTILWFIVIVFLGVGGYIYFFYFNVFDSGVKKGILYSFSRKGNVFKTYEGVILLPGLRSARTGGLNTNEFHFSVEDQALADSLTKCNGMEVEIHYLQYRKNLPWRGENNNNDNKDKGQFIVDDIVSTIDAPDQRSYDNL